MNGAESLVRTLVAGGVDVCFANPGTSEMHFVAALDRVEGMRCVLGLFEGVVTGAADGYYRMKDTPASTLLHLGPGLANGLANLHNAKKANSGIVNIVGQHATYHIDYNAPLTVRHRGPGAADVGLGADLAGREVGRRRRRRRDRRGQERAAADRDPDPARRHRLERGRRHRRGPGGKPARQLFLAGRRRRRQGAAQRRRVDAAADRPAARSPSTGWRWRPDRRQDRLQGDGPDLQSADGARQGPRSRSTAFPT